MGIAAPTAPKPNDTQPRTIQTIFFTDILTSFILFDIIKYRNN